MMPYVECGGSAAALTVEALAPNLSCLVRLQFRKRD